MSHVPANGHYLYECVITGLKNSQDDKRLTHSLLKDLTVPFLREIVISKAAEYLRTTSDCDKGTASLVAEQKIFPKPVTTTMAVCSLLPFSSTYSISVPFSMTRMRPSLAQHFPHSPGQKHSVALGAFSEGATFHI